MKKPSRWFILMPAFVCMVLNPMAVQAGPKKEFPIVLKVDFGPAGKPAHKETLYVEKGTTPKEAVSQVFAVLSGKTCCSFREIKEIAGVKVDPEKNHWWICAVNGSKKIAPARTKLRKDDVVEWNYIEDSQ